MRLTLQQRHTIKELVTQVFGDDVIVHVFGSRLDDFAKGGDIDLLIVSAQPIDDKFRKKLRLNARLQMALGERRFDVVVKDPTTQITPFYQHILEQAQRV